MTDSLKPHPVVPLAQMDVHAFLELRDWLDQALTAAGARHIGGGMGLGAADVEIEMDGHTYVVSIRPLGRWEGPDLSLPPNTPPAGPPRRPS